MAPKTRQWLQHRGWDAPTKGLAWPRCHRETPSRPDTGQCTVILLLLLLLLYSRTGPRRALSLKLSDTRVYEPEK